MHVSISDPLSIGRFLVAKRGEPVVILDSDNPLYDIIKIFCTGTSIVGRQEGVGPIWRGVKGRNEPIDYLPANRPFRIVSFHTDDEIYTAAAARLKASADRRSIPVHIETVPSRGSWEENCNFKAEFIRDQWRNFDVPIVWLDADATLNSYPSLFTTLDADFAINKNRGYIFSGGTLYFGRSPAAQVLLDRWVHHCRANPYGSDDFHLNYAWAEITRELPLRTVWLPESYRCSYTRAGAAQAIIVQWNAAQQAKKSRVVSHKGETFLRRAIEMAKRISPSGARIFLGTLTFVRRRLNSRQGNQRARRASRTFFP